MLRIVVVALVTLGLVLVTTLTLAPAQATSSDFENYIWSFTDVGSDRVVCKKVVMHPQQQLRDRLSNRNLVQMSSTSTVVSDSYCANSAKPYQ
ncbi:MAG: hypothetical protein ICV63_01825 [Coleofasciculus sp. Co-bin14]|nr:hypothetical protein [Coleofasciculus sp. Co-bin14]